MPARRLRLRAPTRVLARTALLAGAVLSLALGCGGGGRPAGEPSEVDSLASQPDRPLVADSAVALEEVFRLTPAERSRADLQAPVDLGYDPEGHLYVLDAGEKPRILKFDSTGQFLFRFGRHEPDVERIGRATSLGVARWNTILLVDKAQNDLLSFLSVGGTYASGVSILGVGMNVLPMPQFGEFYLHKWDPDRRRVYVVHARTPMDSLGVAYSVDIPAGQPIRKEARDVSFKGAVDGQGRLYVGYADGYPIRLLNPAGETVRLIGIDRSPVRKSAAEMAEERSRNLARLRGGLSDVPDSLLVQAAEPDSLRPIVEELAVDPSGRLWVRTHRPDESGITPYDVFNADGRFLARVAVPGTVRRTAFRPDGALVVIDQTSERREIVGYRVELAGE